MTALLAGIDFSSKAIHAALIPLDDDQGDAPAVTLRVFEFASYKSGATTPAFRSVERCRSVHNAVRELLHDPGRHTVQSDYIDVVHVCVETPFGASRKADNVMRELYGAILASIPPHIERDTIATHEWRKIVWPNGPSVASWKTRAIIDGTSLSGRDTFFNEHEAEAYLIARAARTRLHQATKATTTP